MIRLKHARTYIWLISLGLLIWGIYWWLDKPYCLIEHQHPETVRGRKIGLIPYIYPKIIPPTVELEGTPDYAMHMFIQDSDGIKNIAFYIDGQRIPVEFAPGQITLEKEWEGKNSPGTHIYRLYVIDRQGNVGASKSIVRIGGNK